MSLRESLSLRRLNPYFSFMSLSSWLPLAMVWKSSQLPQFPQDFPPQSEVAPDEVDLFRVQNLAQKQRDRRYFTDDDKKHPRLLMKAQLQTFRASSKPTVSSWCWPRSLGHFKDFQRNPAFSAFFAASSEVAATKSPLKTKVVSSRPDSETDKMDQNGLQKVWKSRTFQHNELILTWNRWKPFTMLPGQACRRHESREASECTAVWNETLANSFK